MAERSEPPPAQDQRSADAATLPPRQGPEQATGVFPGGRAEGPGTSPPEGARQFGD